MSHADDTHRLLGECTEGHFARAFTALSLAALLFRLHEQELEAVDLVPRKDLERTIRELTRG